MTSPAGDFTEPTTDYWQAIESDVAPERLRPPFRFGFPARLPDGRFLTLPIRRLSQPDRAVASFIANQASFDALAEFMLASIAPLAPDLLVGLPTLGLALAPILARRLGHVGFAPLGTSRKLWYEERWSRPLRSITTTGAGRSLYIDPNVVPRVVGRRVVIVDDTISSGSTALAALDLMRLVGVDDVGIAVAMSQGEVWRAALAAHDARRVSFVFQSPHLSRVEGGWIPTQRS
jgi:adenine/guanine phosphoribosyltransferase-like PRPP-binding protein